MADSSVGQLMMLEGLSGQAWRLPNPSFFVALASGGLLVIGLNLEMIRVVAISIVREREGALLVGLGYGALLIGVLLSPVRYAALSSGWMGPEGFVLWGQFLPGAGLVAFVGFTSIHLATDFARTYHRLRAANDEIARKSHRQRRTSRPRAGAKE
jgi:hypothetical protein